MSLASLWVGLWKYDQEKKCFNTTQSDKALDPVGFSVWPSRQQLFQRPLGTQVRAALTGRTENLAGLWALLDWVDLRLNKVPLKCGFPIILFRLPASDLSEREKTALEGMIESLTNSLVIKRRFCEERLHTLSALYYWGLSGLQTPETKAWIKPVFTDGKSLILQKTLKLSGTEDRIWQTEDT